MASVGANDINNKPWAAAAANPTGEQHAQMARELVPQLRQVMGE
ncbi:MAG: hypothetical protein ACJ8LG_08185 [Massilia sp.]